MLVFCSSRNLPHQAERPAESGVPVEPWWVRFTFVVYLAEFLGNKPVVQINCEVNLPWPTNRSRPSLNFVEFGARQKAAF